MGNRKVSVVTMVSVGDTDKKAKRVKIYEDDGTFVDPNDAPAITQLPQEFQIFEKQQLLDMISTAVVAATSAQAKKGATPESVRQATHAALGVSQQVSGPEPLES